MVYRRSVLDEQYVARKGSIEQQFVIPQPLALAGADLRIRGQVQSGGVLETRDERWVWRGEDKEIWLGQVYVYDAQGTTLPSRLEVSQGETTIVIEGQALARASYPVVVDPEIGTNDFRLSDMGPDGNAGFYAFEPAIAYNSTNSEYLVVWRGNDNTGKLVGEYEIFGQRWSNCGDGVVDEGEECEPGDDVSIGGGPCTAECTINLCGNGVVDDGEDCDLGLSNGLPGSLCTFSCQFPYTINLERLKDLVASCEICPPEVRGSLVDILSRTQTQLDKGNIKGALNTIQQFVKKTQQFLRKGQLPDAEGRRLQLQAEVIIAQLEEQLARR